MDTEKLQEKKATMHVTKTYKQYMDYKRFETLAYIYLNSCNQDTNSVDSH